MASKTENVPKAIQIISKCDEKFALHEENLNMLLNRKDIEECQVMILSVAGEYRLGKSFLLNFFLKYLNYTYNERRTGDEWLGQMDEQLTGFKFRRGSKRHTEGLWLWSEPFVATLKNNKKVAILLMDTQGTFDSNSTSKDNTFMFSISMLISSVQIYNVSRQISEASLQYLELFTEYGRLAQQIEIESNKQAEKPRKPFQHLQILIRDWQSTSQYGGDAGEILLNDTLQIYEGQPEELRSLRKNIKAYHENTKCFLLPYPGKEVATNDHFNGKLSDIEEDFLTYIKQFVPLLVSPKNLNTKLIGGRHVTPKDLLQYLRSYVKIFNEDKLPEVKNLLTAITEAQNSIAVADGLNEYNRLMNEVCNAKPYLRLSKLQKKHDEAKDRALNIFDMKTKIGASSLRCLYRQRLIEGIEKKIIEFHNHNNLKEKPLPRCAVIAYVVLYLLIIPAVIILVFNWCNQIVPGGLVVIVYYCCSLWLMPKRTVRNCCKIWLQIIRLRDAILQAISPANVQATPPWQ